MNITDLRRRALSMLEQRGEMFGQDLACELVEKQWKPQGATRWIGGYMMPLIKAGYVRKKTGDNGFGNYYSITQDGKKAIRL